jgi:hypothetical protein
MNRENLIKRLVDRTMGTGDKGQVRCSVCLWKAGEPHAGAVAKE